MVVTLRNRTPGGTTLHGFVDTDWASDVNDRKSTLGFVFMLGGVLVVARQAIVEMLHNLADIAWEFGVMDGAGDGEGDGEGLLDVEPRVGGRSKLCKCELVKQTMREEGRELQEEKKRER